MLSTGPGDAGLTSPPVANRLPSGSHPPESAHERGSRQHRQRDRGHLHLFIPGLGQLVQGRLLKAIVMFVLAAVLWIVWLGWLIHLWSILDAALYKPQG